jgi:hypothetical protein
VWLKDWLRIGYLDALKHILVPREYHHFPGYIDLLAAPELALGVGYCQGSKSGIQIMQGLGIASKKYIIMQTKKWGRSPTRE